MGTPSDGYSETKVIAGAGLHIPHDRGDDRGFRGELSAGWRLSAGSEAL